MGRIKSVFSSMSQWVSEHIISPISSLVPQWLKNLFGGGRAKAEITVKDERNDKSPGKKRPGHTILAWRHHMGGRKGS